MAILISGDGKAPRKKEIVAAPINPAKAVEVTYRNELKRIIRPLTEFTIELGADIRSGEINQVEALARLEEREKFIADTINDQQLANAVVGAASKAQKARFERMLANTLGVDVLQIIGDEGIDQVFKTAVFENAGLIRDISKKQISQVQRAVFDNFAGRKLKGGTLSQEIQRVAKVTKSRADLIARDQSQKLNSAFNRARQEANGIEEYIWKTVGDSRVRDLHAARNGKKFRWDSPPSDGHPGEPVNCRCVAKAVINHDKLDIL